MDAPRRLAICRQAILDRDFQALSDVVEQDSNMMHSVMCTSNPSLVYWNPVTFDVMKAVMELKKTGCEACYTIDAGPNVHVITQKQHIKVVQSLLQEIPGVLRIVVAPVGKGVKLVD
jgi:diphosphomevalonate decarboxylase